MLPICWLSQFETMKNQTLADCLYLDRNAVKIWEEGIGNAAITERRGKEKWRRRNWEGWSSRRQWRGEKRAPEGGSWAATAGSRRWQPQRQAWVNWKAASDDRLTGSRRRQRGFFLWEYRAAGKRSPVFPPQKPTQQWKAHRKQRTPIEKMSAIAVDLIPRESRNKRGSKISTWEPRVWWFDETVLSRSETKRPDAGSGD